MLGRSLDAFAASGTAPARALGPRTRGYPSVEPMTPNSPPPVLVDRVQKRFEIPRDQVSTLKERALHPLRRSVTDTLHALRGVSFAVEPGEFFGIVGRNGSGKSTLLKCLAGIYSVDSGNIYVNGRMSTFIELGVGFNPDLPARDNVLLNATMLGLSPREARKRFDSVIDFAELGDFVEMKIKNYSSGMLVRLAFAVMIHVDAEILLIDEVLAVGDAAFQQKCYDEFERIRDSGATGPVRHTRHVRRPALLRSSVAARARPTGDAGRSRARRQPLPRAELLRAGAAAGGGGRRGRRRRAAGIPAPQRTRSRTRPRTPSPTTVVHRFGDGRAEIHRSLVRGRARRRARTRSRRAGRARSARACDSTREVENPLFGINLQNGHRDHLLSASNLWSEPRLRRLHRAGDEVDLRIRFENVLAPGRYYVTPGCRSPWRRWIDRRERMLSIVVTGTQSTDALRRASLRDRRSSAGRPRRRRASRPMSAPTTDQPEPLADWSPSRLASARTSDQGPVGAGVRSARGCGTSRGRSRKTEFKLAFFGSALGYLWQLMRPLLLFGVIYLVVHAGRKLSPTATSRTSRPRCCSGIVLFNFFSEATGGRRQLPRRPREPRAQDRVPAPGGADLDRAHRAVEPGAQPRSRWSIFLLAAGGSPRWSWLELPLLISLLAAASAPGSAMILSVVLRALPRRPRRSGKSCCR